MDEQEARYSMMESLAKQFKKVATEFGFDVKIDFQFQSDEPEKRERKIDSFKFKMGWIAARPDDDPECEELIDYASDLMRAVIDAMNSGELSFETEERFRDIVCDAGFGDDLKPCIAGKRTKCQQH